MASIKEVIEDVKDSMGDNGFMYLAIGVGALFVISLLKDSGGGSSYTVPTSYASYPDAVTNANVIIDTLQENIEYSEQNIKDYIDEGLTATNTNINTQFEYLNDYMNEGFSKQEELSNKIYDSTMNGFGEIKEQIVDVNSNISNVGATVSSTFNSMSNTISSLQSQLDSVQSDVSNIGSTVNKIDKTTTSTNTTANAIKNATTSTKSSSTSTNVGTTKTSTSTLKTSYTGNSIVDGLKSAGVNSSYAYRSQLAAANGIKNYTGSASQNTALLDKLKKGTLKSV